MQGKEYAYFILQCLSLGADVNTRRMSKPYMGSIFHIKKQGNFLVIGKCYVNYQNHQNLMILTFSDTKRTMMHLFMFTNSAQRELVRIVYATEINFPCIITLGMTRYKRNAIYANFVQLLPCSQTITDLLLSSQN